MSQEKIRRGKMFLSVARYHYFSRDLLEETKVARHLITVQETIMKQLGSNSNAGVINNNKIPFIAI